MATWKHQAATSADRWLWDPGLTKDPSKDYKYVAQEDDTQWFVADGGEALFTGNVASDGSRVESW